MRTVAANSTCAEPQPLAILYCHPATPCPAVYALQAEVDRIPGGGLRLRYTLSGDLDQIRIPVPQFPAFTDGLWEHTCFEAFIGVRGESSYHEFNFSPSGQWVVYAFSSYRERLEWQAESEPTAHPAPFPDKGRAGDGFLLEALIPATALPPNPENKPFELSLTAVIETTTGEKSYWALKHTTARPDFHHRNGFIHEIWP